MHEARPQRSRAIWLFVGRESGPTRISVKSPGEYRVDVRAQMSKDNSLAMYSLFEANGVCWSMVMMESLREIHIKICLARVVMYSQRHIC